MRKRRRCPTCPGDRRSLSYSAKPKKALVLLVLVVLGLRARMRENNFPNLQPLSENFSPDRFIKTSRTTRTSRTEAEKGSGVLSYSSILSNSLLDEPHTGLEGAQPPPPAEGAC